MQKGTSAPVLKILAFCVVALAVVAVLRFVDFSADKKPAGDSNTVVDAGNGAGLTGGGRAPRASGSSTSPSADDPVFLKPGELSPAAPTPTPEPVDQGMESRRSYLKTTFKDGGLSLAGFELDGLEVTPGGIKLADGPGVDGVRKGVMVSPPLPLKHASNMVAPIWKGSNPEGSNTQVEMQVVQGGAKSPWYVVEISDEEISPTYPDGRPNPNFGSNVGSPIGFGLELYDDVRYRVTLTAAGADSPLLEEMNVYHADSTHGEGFPADEPPPERGILGAAANAEN